MELKGVWLREQTVNSCSQFVPGARPLLCVIGGNKENPLVIEIHELACDESPKAGYSDRFLLRLCGPLSVIFSDLSCVFFCSNNKKIQAGDFPDTVLPSIQLI